MNLSRPIVALFVALLIISTAPAAMAAPQSAGRPDHSSWDMFLDNYVRPGPDGVNRVDYAAVTKADKDGLDAYIRQLAAVDIDRYDRDTQYAYWVNLYNALTVQLVLDHYPLESIRDIKPGFFSIGPWKMDLVTVGGEELSLDAIEHGILREKWDDNRVHYAVNCASIGCPDLARSAYRGATLHEMLDRQARAYINHPRGVAIDGDRLVVSKIYRWYKEDFGGNEQGVIDHLMKYAEPALRDALSNFDHIDKTRYDWSLNDVEKSGD